MRISLSPLLALAALLALPDESAASELKMRHPEGQVVLQQILADDVYWSDAQRKTYADQLYDEIRIKSTETGYVPMITGEGKEDFPQEVVADIIFDRSDDLPRHLGGCKVALPLGSGYDAQIGSEYRDLFYVFDFQLFYGHFAQRMYRRHDAAKNETVLWFEKLDARFVDAATWTSYSQRMTSAIEGVEKRWPPFNAVVEVGDVYGMYLVAPGKVQTSRVSFVSKLTFDESAGIIARWGSSLRPVVRAAIQAGFDAQVAIASDELARRQGTTAAKP